MALSIKDPEVERLAEEVAELAGETTAEAVRKALSERRDRLSLTGARHHRGRAFLQANPGCCFGIMPQEDDRMFDLFEELFPESAPIFFVVLDCFGELSLRQAVERDAFHRRDERSLRNTSSAGMPGSLPLLIS
jgi:hypothetical protein